MSAVLIAKDLGKLAEFYEQVFGVRANERSANQALLDVGGTRTSRARQDAQRLGGTVDEFPTLWAAADNNFCLGHDPEGNVLGVAVP
ncbi:MAG TPA: hypothetical protein VFS58_10000 [Steroidobacteraceae bacterium]|nr:hypothetical protein [Steroidobacteraceae bacterium]